MRNIGRVIAASATAKLRSKIRALNLIILLDLAPRRVADCAGDIDFEFQERHKNQFTTEGTERTEET
jgi:hypothetical protein